MSDEKPDDKPEVKPEDTPDTPPPNPDPTPNTEPRRDDDLRAVVTTLSETVAGLAQRVEQIAPSTPADETPTNLPWTHRGKF